MNIKVTGLTELAASLGATKERMREATRAGIYAVAEETLTRAKLKVPVDTGALRSSGVVTFEGADVLVGFGGPAAPYAVVQHEDTSLQHPEGGEAKFLERALYEELGGPAEATLARVARDFLERGR